MNSCPSSSNVTVITEPSGPRPSSLYRVAPVTFEVPEYGDVEIRRFLRLIIEPQ